MSPNDWGPTPYGEDRFADLLEQQIFSLVSVMGSKDHVIAASCFSLALDTSSSFSSVVGGELG